MPLILFIDFVVVVVLVTVYKRRGLEAVLPYFVFIITLMPDECRINLGGLFDLYTRRLALIVLAILFYSASRQGADSRLSAQESDVSSRRMGAGFDLVLDRGYHQRQAVAGAGFGVLPSLLHHLKDGQQCPHNFPDRLRHGGGDDGLLCFWAA